jgi:DNA-binding HxlR family transcriptional regulator
MGRKIITNVNNCPMTHAMNILGGKWKPIILYLLSNGTLRFGKFFIFMPTISRKVLTDQLRELEADGLIIRKKYAEIPPRVEYSLSDKGQSLIPILEKLTAWIAEHNMFETCKLD